MGWDTFVIILVINETVKDNEALDSNTFIAISSYWTSFFNTLWYKVNHNYFRQQQTGSCIGCQEVQMEKTLEVNDSRLKTQGSRRSFLSLHWWPTKGHRISKTNWLDLKSPKQVKYPKETFLAWKNAITVVPAHI